MKTIKEDLLFIGMILLVTIFIIYIMYVAIKFNYEVIPAIMTII